MSVQSTHSDGGNVDREFGRFGPAQLLRPIPASGFEKCCSDLREMLDTRKVSPLWSNSSVTLQRLPLSVDGFVRSAPWKERIDLVAVRHCIAIELQQRANPAARVWIVKGR